MSYNSPELPTGAFITLGLAAAAVIPAGTLVARNAAGDAVPAGNTAGITVIGRAEADSDNTGGSAGDTTVLVKRGCFRFDNSATSTVTKAALGKPAFAESGKIIRLAAESNKVVAGIVVLIEDDGVFIDTTQNAALQPIALL